MQGAQLAQINVAHLRHAMEAPEMADFVAALDNINALAERSAGFIWRFTDEGGADATGARIDGRDDLLINMSVWTDIESLRTFVYKTAHAAMMARRAKWFPAFGGAHMALWWVPAGVRPTLAEAAEKLASLDAYGPMRDAFTFDAPFDAAGEPVVTAPIVKDCA
jgi:hypothetical protein